jgi:serine/threonine protein kinase
MESKRVRPEDAVPQGFKKARNEVAVLQGFSWHSVDPKIFESARLRVSDMEKIGKTAVNWESLQWLPQGFYIAWKDFGGTYRAGYHWFSRVIGDLSDTDGNTLQWCVIGHPRTFDPCLWESFKEAGCARKSLRSVTDISVQAPMKRVSSSSFFSSGAAKCDNHVELQNSLPALPSWRCLTPAFRLAAFGEIPVDLSQGIYNLSEIVGGRSCGEVYRSSRDGWAVVLKILRPKTSSNDLLREAMPEVCTLDRCLDHPHITQLWDIFFENKSLCLVFESWGEDLSQALGKKPEGFQPSAIAALARQACEGLGHLHKMCLLHGNLNPASILIRVLDQCSVSIKISDLGGVLAAEPSGRGKVVQNEVETNDVLLYRALEILFGGQDFGVEVDSWSLGIILAESAGFPFASSVSPSTATKMKSWSMSHLFRQIGTPSAASGLRELPLWPQDVASFSPVAWPAEVHKGLGVLGVGFLWDLLAFNPANRLKACDAREHPYFKHDALELFVSSSELLPHDDADWPPEFQGAPGCHVLAKHRVRLARLKNKSINEAKNTQPELPLRPGLSGHRHECNILCGFNAPDVSAWLLADQGVTPGSTAFKALQLDFGEETSSKR